jgi:O-antigen/teichoic acid export membrane protein
MLINERTRRLFKEGSWILLGQIMMVVGSLAGVRLLTELLTSDAYGELALGMTVATLVNQIILGPLGGGVLRFYAPAVERGDVAGYFNATKKLMLLAAMVIILIVLFSIAGLFFAGQTQWVPITVSALVFSILGGYSANLSGILTAARQRSIVAIHQGIDPFLRASIAAGLILWVGMSSAVAMIGYVIAALLTLGSQAYFFRKVVPTNLLSKNNINWHQDIWKYSWPIGIFGVFTWLQLASDRWALQIFSSTKDVGSFAVLYQLGYTPIALITGMASQFLVPILFQRAGDSTDSERNSDVYKLSWRLTWLSLLLTGIAFLVAILLHDKIFGILVAEEYRSVSYLLPWIIIAGGMFASGQSLANSLLAQMKTRELIIPKIASALLGLTLNFAGAYWYGIVGIVGAAIFFSIVYFLWMVVLVMSSNREFF